MKQFSAAILSKIETATGMRQAVSKPDPQREARLRTQLRSGSLYTVAGNKLTDCLFINISLHGARLRQSSELRLPPKLIAHDERLGIRFEAEIRWQRGLEAGIFIPDGVPAWVPYLKDDSGRTTLVGRPSSPGAQNASGIMEDRRRDPRMGR